MGIDKNDFFGIIHALEQNVSFKNTLQIGRQSIYYKPRMALRERLAKRYPNGDFSAFDAEYAEELFAFFGAENVDSIDASAYEGATIIHDMNLPIDMKYHERYTCVYDGGCLEHVYNFPVAVRNCMNMVSSGGHLILHTPANNYYGHGFYQFSPELFYSLLSENNGFSNTKVYAHNNRDKWYEVKSPAAITMRVDLVLNTRKPLRLFVISQRVGKIPDNPMVLQSDYVGIWNNGKGGSTFGFSGVKLLLFKCYKNLPLSFRNKVGERLYRYALLKTFYVPVKDFGRI